MDDPLPFISVIMPVCNEGVCIEKVLNQVMEQCYPEDRYEILVVDGMSTDNTVEIVENFGARIKNLKILVNPCRRSSVARNIGIKSSRGEYLIILDGHVYLPSRNLFADMVKSFQATGLEVLCRPQPLVPPDNSNFQSAVAYARGSAIGHGLDSNIYNIRYEGEIDPSSSGAMYRRTIFENVGYIDEGFDAAEDYEFNYRLSRKGYRSYTSPKLTVYYYPRDSLAGLFKQMGRYGLGRYRLMKKHREQILSGNLIPPLFFLVLAMLTGFSIFRPSFRPFAAGLGASYLGIIFAVSILISFKKGLRYLLLLPIIFFTIHFGLASGFLAGFIRKNKQVLG